MVDLKLVYKVFSVKVKMMSSVKNKRKAGRRFSGPIILEDLNNKDRQQNQISSDISKRASIPSRLSSLSTKDPPTLPLICSQFHSIRLDPFPIKDHSEQQEQEQQQQQRQHEQEQQEKQQQRPLSMPTPRYSAIHSLQVSKRSSVPTSTLILTDVSNTTNITNDDNSGNNNSNNNNNNNNNNNKPYSSSIENASRSVPSLTLVRDIDVPPTPSTPTPKKLQFSSTILTHDTWTRDDYDRRGDQSTCNKLTPLLAQRIKRELNEYKMTEMQVHEDSKKNTHFFA